MAMNTGRNVGRVSIRVVPDTTRFRNDLRDKLRTIERTTSMTVRVDKANIDRVKFRESIRQQIADMRDLEIDANVKPTVDGVIVRRDQLRKAIQDQFDLLEDVRVWINPDIRREAQERFHKTVRDMVDRASDNQVDIGVAAHTTLAAAQLAYTSRTRFVDLIVRVNQASVRSAATTIAALSGARLSWNWIEDLGRMFRDLDKNLPTILGWTSAITALFGTIFAAGSGLVGLGQGLFTITPALLTVPGLLLNAIGSLTVLIVALKHAKTELAVLSDDMNELGGIIRETFWDNAREPIINLVQGLMPQLRNSFRELSQGVGQFSGALADAFGRSLAGGRLESIFGGIAEGWRVLSTGADGFAGAITSLSQIAATYTPRLAAWFVRQANTFDKFLTDIATDGRLSRWMEQAIVSMYDLWDATTGFAGVLEGIWTAADQAGSTGLAGFADLMQTWERTVKSADFQRGLAAIFRGSYVAMDAFGDALIAIGRLVADMPMQFERFVGSVGGFIGGLIEAVAVSLNNNSFAAGLDAFSAGLDAALAGIAPALDPIAVTFGNFLGLLGELARTALPTAAGVIAALTPAIDSLIGTVEPVLQPLADSVTAIAESLAPAIETLVVALGPTLQEIVLGLAEALEELAPIIADLVEALSFIPDLLNLAKPEEPLSNPGLGGDAGWISKLSDILTNYKVEAEVIFKGSSDNPQKLQEAAGLLADEYKRILEERGPEAGQAFLDGIAEARLPSAFADAVKEALPEYTDMFDRGRTGGGGFSRGLTEGLATAYPELAAALNSQGSSSMAEFGAGLTSGKDAALAAVSSIPPDIRAMLPPTMLDGIGTGAMTAFGLEMAVTGALAGQSGIDAVKAGVETQYPALAAALNSHGSGSMTEFANGLAGGRESALGVIRGLPPEIQALIPRDILNSIGADITRGLGAGMKSWSALDTVRGAARLAVGEAVFAAKNAAGVRSPSRVMAAQVGRFLSTGVAMGMDQYRHVVGQSARRLVDVDLFGGATGRGAAGLGHTEVNVTMPLLPGETPQEQRDNVIKEFKWAF